MKQKLRKYQLSAVKAIRNGFRKRPRAQIHMACGTGKTLIGTAVAERMGAKTVLVMVPSLMLAQQTLLTFRRQGFSKFLAVCSEMQGEEDIAPGEVGCDVTTDPKEVTKFLKKPGCLVVICTYQSGRLLKGKNFDLAIFDEAHRTAGSQGKPFAFAISDKNVKCHYRLFMTATPRHVELKETGEETLAYSMDDAKVYGPAVYELPLRRAIEMGIVCDYKIVVSVLKKPVDVENGLNAAIQAAILRAMRQYEVKKVFTFHRTVKDAANFTNLAYDNTSNIGQCHVSSRQPSSVREQELELFRAWPRAWISNAKCLVEGVDLPETDMVAFLSCKKSVVEVTQAVGRALRRHPGKKCGYVFVPVFVEQHSGENIEEAVQRSGFKPVWDVLQALHEQDEVLSIYLKQKTTTAIKSDGISERLVIDGSAITSALRRAVGVRVLKPFSFGKSQAIRATLLEMVDNGGELPAEMRRNFRLYTNPRRLEYNKQFTEYVVSKAPESWFDTVRQHRVRVNKELLISIARSGKERPAWKSALGRVLSRYLDRYPDFCSEILKIRPNWSKRGAKQKRLESRKLQVFSWAKSGMRRPGYRTKKGLVIDYCLRNAGPQFGQAIKRIAPSWFITRSDTHKAKLIEIMKLANGGGNCPKDGSLANAMRYAQYYDKSWSTQLRRTRPDWFGRKVHSPKQARRKRVVERENRSSIQ